MVWGDVKFVKGPVFFFRTVVAVAAVAAVSAVGSAQSNSSSEFSGE